jgi:hypothetical protein
MFPITDLSRADDIRTRRRRAVLLLVGMVAVPSVLFSGHHDPASARHGWADPEQAALPAGRRETADLSGTGTSLLVRLGCATITLLPRAGLDDRVLVSARHGSRRQDLAGLLLTGSGSELVLSGTCHSSELVVQLPASMPISLMPRGDADVRLGAFSGPVHLVQHGDGDVAIESTGPLEIEKRGDGDISIDRLEGSLRMVASGGGDLSIARVRSDRVDIDASGFGDISIKSGHIDRLDASLHGSNDLSIEAGIDTASVRAPSDADIELPNIRGRLDRVNFAQ